MVEDTGMVDTVDKVDKSADKSVYTGVDMADMVEVGRMVDTVVDTADMAEVGRARSNYIPHKYSTGTDNTAVLGKAESAGKAA